MQKKILIKASNEYIFFSDKKDQSRLFATTEKEVVKYHKLKERLGPDAQISDSEELEAFELQSVGAMNEYTVYWDIVQKESIQFPMNRIKWSWIPMG